MIHAAEELTLRDGRCCTIRSVEPDDAGSMLEYMKIMLGETPFLLRTPEEFNYSAEEEAAVLTRRRDDPRCLMLLVVLDGRIITRPNWGILNSLPPVPVKKFRLIPPHK